ncbi:MAG: hypothetical protein QOC92_1437 [Acidimicrobiaceae bacterium]|jgi:hypothetical protein
MSKTRTVRTTRRRLQLADSRDERDPSNTPASLTAALPRLAATLDDAAEQAGWGGRPSLVRITAWPSEPVSADHGAGGFDLGIRPLDADTSVVEALCGFTAPDTWLAIGVVTEGNARALDDRAAEPRRVRCVHLVDRSGASASTVRLRGEEATVLSSLDDHDPSGRVDDVCRRALGLATAPPVHTSIELWALVWLERVIASRGCAPDSRVAWREIAELHPAVALVVADDERWGAEPANSLTRLAEVLADVHSWSVLRTACAAREWPVADIPPEVAAWLDDGAFRRWLIGTFPPIEQLAAAARELVPPSVGRRLQAALRAWRLSVDPS